MTMGLAELFGSDAWVPVGHNQMTDPLKAAFLGLLVNGQIDGAGTCANILGLIPNATRNTFDMEPRSQRGFKFVWANLSGVQWQVHGHEPDAGAQQGHVGGGGWTMRVRCGQEYLMSQQWVCGFPANHANYSAPTHWKRATTQQTIGMSHIPIVNP